MIQIIHLSDLHFPSDTPGSKVRILYDSLINDIYENIKPNSLLILTGDLINKGGAFFTDKECMFLFLEEYFFEKLIKKVPQLKNRIFIVPGNHDIERDKIDDLLESGIQAKIKDEKELEQFILKNREESKYLDQLKAYKEWEKAFYKGNPYLKEITNFDNSFIVDNENFSIGISCLNSAWMCKDDNDSKRILIGANQIDHSYDLIKDCGLKLALSHHHYDFLQEFDGDELKKSIPSKYDIFLTGHEHKLDFANLNNLYGNLFISTANSCIGDKNDSQTYISGYSILEYSKNEKVTIYYRKYLPDHKKFVINTDIGNDGGKKEFPLLKEEEIENFNKGYRFVEHILNSNIDKINDDIIVASNHTQTECTLENLFVEPRLLNSPGDSLKKADTISYSINSIIESDENYLIYGIKESGKTILIDKFLIETAKSYSKLRKIPVLLKFNDLLRSGIERKIKEFAGVSTFDFDNFMKSNKVLLLIDDFSFSGGEDFLNSLCELKTKYPKLQLVCSSTLHSENTIPIDNLQLHKILKFTTIFIQNFNTNEIKTFISKWYRKSNIDLHDNMQRLIKSFIDFGLPKTPLSVTMFIWTFEKQEKKPINNSVLVEIFVENILEKSNMENIYSETFDFQNKKRLLAFIAKHMLDKGDSDANYSILYSTLLTFIENYLSSRFTGKANKVLDDFISRGILSYEDHQLLKFKSSFLFSYFLSIYIDHDDKFKQYIFEDDNYLDFIEEIIYYTGIKRDETSVLDFVQKKLSEIYSIYNDHLVQNYNKIDTVLESGKNKTLASKMDEKKVKVKLSDGEIEQMYDDTLSSIPTNTTIEKKGRSHSRVYILDKTLKLACIVLKHSEDIDDIEIKRKAYKNFLLSSIAYFTIYRDSLVKYYNEFRIVPESFPQNIDFHLFIKILPMLHQVLLFDWLGTPKLIPVLLDKIQSDKTNTNISELEKFISVFLVADIKTVDYPKIIQHFVLNAKCNFIKDISFLKILSYYHLRNNTPELDGFYLKLMTDIKQQLGEVNKQNKNSFIKKLEDSKNEQSEIE